MAQSRIFIVERVGRAAVVLGSTAFFRFPSSTFSQSPHQQIPIAQHICFFVAISLIRQVPLCHYKEYIQMISRLQPDCSRLSPTSKAFSNSTQLEILPQFHSCSAVEQTIPFSGRSAVEQSPTVPNQQHETFSANISIYLIPNND